MCLPAGFEWGENTAANDASVSSAMRSILRSLDEIRPSDGPYVGGKAFHCASLKQAGFPVPDGVVLTTEAMDGALDSPALHEWLASLPSNALLAVRSSGIDEDSAGHSFAGIHET